MVAAADRVEAIGSPTNLLRACTAVYATRAPKSSAMKAALERFAEDPAPIVREAVALAKSEVA